MLYLGSSKFFDIGLFAEAHYNVDLFSSNMYLMQMLAGAVEEYEKAQAEYEAAVEMDDWDLMERKQREIDMCEGNFAMASSMLDFWEKVYS